MPRFFARDPEGKGVRVDVIDAYRGRSIFGGLYPPARVGTSIAKTLNTFTDDQIATNLDLVIAEAKQCFPKRSHVDGTAEMVLSQVRMNLEML